MTTLVLSLTTLLGGFAPADTVSACDFPEARQFDFWIGEWDVLNRYRVDDGTWAEAGRATNKVFAILDGCAIVELWDGYLGRNHFRGFSVRAYDREEDAWVLVLNWPAPNRPQFFTLQGGFRHGRGEFVRESSDSAGNPLRIRYTFSDITPTSLRWNDGTSHDGGRSWETRWIMEFNRRDPIKDLPLVNLPLRSPSMSRLCDTAEARQFDFVLGTWEGVGPAAGDPSIDVESLQILDGCASMDFLELKEKDETVELFFVRAYEPSIGRWVLYSISTAEPTFRRYEGSVEGDRAVLAGGAGKANLSRRLTWSAVSPDTLSLEMARSTDGGRSWESRSSTLTRRR